MGDPLPAGARNHLEGCSECADYARAADSVSSRAEALRVSAPAHLKAVILQRSLDSRPAFPLKLAAAGLAIVLVLGVPLALFTVTRLTAKVDGNSGLIGNWPRYHCVMTMYPGRAQGNQAANVQDIWVQKGAARSVEQSGTIIVHDFLIKEESGVPVRYERNSDGTLERTPDGGGYYYTPDGHVKKDLAASASFSPFSNDLRWAVDIPANFRRLTRKTTSATLPSANGQSISAVCETVISSDRESKVVCYREPGGQPLFVEHFTTVHDDKSATAAKQIEDYVMRFDYSPAPAGTFDENSLAKPSSGLHTARPLPATSP
ncbi:MAG TPA: hypothetical protein VG944_09465 [Fimbriimonas sp.]|nr:hypothetical protein [Fimbriimonas sp.]